MYVTKDLPTHLLSTTKAASHTLETGQFQSNELRGRCIFIGETGKLFMIARAQKAQKMVSLDALHGCCGDLPTSQ